MVVLRVHGARLVGHQHGRRGEGLEAELLVEAAARVAIPVSAGSVLAARLEGAIRPVFIGTPTGSAPNLALNPVKETLPHSKFQVSVSRERYIATRESDTRRAVYPDLEWDNTFDDYAYGRDSALELAKTQVSGIWRSCNFGYGL